MLYLALPPAPPPIIITLTPEQVADNPVTGKTSVAAKLTKASLQNSGMKSATKAQTQVCLAPQLQPPKSDLVSNLLGKMLAASIQQKQEAGICATPQKKKSYLLSFQGQIQKSKPAKGFSPAASQSTENTALAGNISTTKEQHQVTVIDITSPRQMLQRGEPHARLLNGGNPRTSVAPQRTASPMPNAPCPIPDN